MAQPLLTWTPSGLYCPAGDFYIDPHRAVSTALVTHGHSDHARRGSKKYFCAQSSVGILRCRLGKKIEVQGASFGEPIRFGGATVSFHPAGHILGSAQVRVEVGGEVWVASGDYKRDPDPSCEPFESVRCDTFITEATFGTPKYRWSKSAEHGRDFFEWWQGNAAEGKNSLLFGYSLGKSQRILAELAPWATRPIWIHESIHDLTECYRAEGRVLAPTRVLPSEPWGADSLFGEELTGDLILAPPSILQGAWREKLNAPRTAFASGWMHGQTKANPYRGGDGYDRGFVLSDHADWDDLNRTIDESGARQVFVMHRENGALIRHLRKRGLDVHPITALEETAYARLPPVNLSLFEGLHS